MGISHGVNREPEAMSSMGMGGGGGEGSKKLELGPEGCKAGFARRKRQGAGIPGQGAACAKAGSVKGNVV